MIKEKVRPSRCETEFQDRLSFGTGEGRGTDTGAPPSVTCQHDFYFQRLKSDIIRREGGREKERKIRTVEGGGSFDTGALVTPLNHTIVSLFVQPLGCSMVYSLILMKARSTSLDTATDLFN